jgi:MFS family permease
VAVLASLVYLLTIEPTTSFWDCGEFIASSFKLEVGHPPGNPVFNLFARFFTLFTSPEHAAVAVNAMSAICSGLTIFFLYLTIVHFGRRIQEKRGRTMTKAVAVGLFGAGIVGAFAYCFSDTFWFSAVEGEVYAMSSLFTAIALWAALKWEEQADLPYANRWLILICFLMGLSIGVHLLNLLTVPAIVFLIYYKKHEKPVSFWRAFGVLAASGAILAVVLFGIIPYLPRLAAGVDRLFVNGFGAKFDVGAAVFMALFLAACFLLLYVFRKKNKALAHTITLMVTTIVIGFSLFTITIIRSSAGTPTNEYQPDNPYSLIRYLNREQYGSNPILYGQMFTSPYEVEEKPYWTPLDDKYFHAINVDATFPAGAKMLFPRMWNGFDERYKEFYKQYVTKYNTRRVDLYGRKVNIQMPTMADNLKCFFDYQVNYMYVRYFMWNFVGRQNDLHGDTPGDLTRGNWESGIGFIDRVRLGDQSEGPDFIVHNRGKNHYFFLPLLLGLIGFFFQLRHDPRNSWVTGLLFLLTGLAIVVYLNQPPYQVRERDYAYAGSFYVFALWIGLGVLAVQNWIERLAKHEDGMPAAALAVAVGLIVPVLMGCQNWDDHDRSGRYTARDMAWNHLVGCGPNALLVTHGDNDTFPLWYAQEVEGVRTDVRIVNSSLLGTDWYIDQMKCRFYESDPVNISIPRRQYLYGTNDFCPVIDKVDRPVLASEALAIFKDSRFTDQGLDYLPAHKLLIPVNKDNAIRAGIVKESMRDSLEDFIALSISGNNITKFDLIMLDILANYDWSRPIYFVSRNETKLGLEPWLQYDGFIYKLVPYLNDPSGREDMLDVDAMYDRIMHQYRFESMADTTIHIDYQNLFTFSAVVPVRDLFATTASALIDRGDKKRAEEVLDKCIEVLPERNFPYNVAMFRSLNEWSMLTIIDDYFLIGQPEKAMALGDKFADETIKTILYFSTPIGPKPDDILSNKLYEDAVNTYLYLVKLYNAHGRQDAAKALESKLKGE